MDERIRLMIDQRPVEVPAGVSVAVALALCGQETNRISVSGEARGPVCGMGICFECRVTIDNIPDRLGCQTLCQPGMIIDTTPPFTTRQVLPE